jgi:serine phosphatase RsbU (regulator of sigma subunit)
MTRFFLILVSGIMLGSGIVIDTSAIINEHLEKAAGNFEKQQNADGFDELLEALHLAEQTNNDSLKGIVHFRIGSANYNYGTILDALRHFEKAAYYFQKGNIPDQLARVENQMGNAQLNFKNYTSALKLYESAKKYWDKTGNKKMQAILHNNFGIAHNAMGDTIAARIDYTAALQLRSELKDSVGMGQTLNNIGALYYDQKKYTSAYVYFQRGYDLRVRFKAPVLGILESQVNIGKTLLQLNRFAEAEIILRKAQVMAQEYRSVELQRRCAEQLKDLLAKSGRYAEAYKMQELYYQLNDSLFGLEKRDQTLRSGVRYRYEKKMLADSLKRVETEQKEILQREKEKLIEEEKDKRQLILFAAMSVVLVFLGVIAFILFRSNREKQKANFTISSQKHQIQVKQKEIVDSITYAKRIQETLNPSEEEIEKNFPESFVLYLPKDIISGDFYWTGEHGRYNYIALADCTGHGVPGAMMSMLGISFLNETLKDKGSLGPARMLDELQRRMMSSLHRNPGKEGVNDGMDLSLLCIDKERRMLTFALAGRPMLVISGGLAKLYKGDRASIGGSQEQQIKPFSQLSVSLKPGDMLYLYSDGFVDQFGGPAGKKFKSKPLETLLTEVSNISPDQQKHKLLQAFQAWKGELEQVDDVTVVGIKL